MGLLWAVPAWAFSGWRLSLAFVGVVLLTVMVPDVDLYLPGVVHHGITHTVLFVGGVALLGGAVVAHLAGPTLRRWWRRDAGEEPSATAVYLFVAGGLLLGV